MMLAIAEELLRTAMVSNYIDMKQEMADRITHAWEYMCECLQIGRRETENAYVLKAFGGKVKEQELLHGGPVLHQRICVGHHAQRSACHVTR